MAAQRSGEVPLIQLAVNAFPRVGTERYRKFLQ